LSLIESIILGLVQGLTEFLPISSSGHLVIGETLFGINGDDLVFEVLVHFGTMVAVIIYFRARLWAIVKSIASYPISKSTTEDDKSNLRMALYLIVGTIPAAIIGLILKENIETAFASPKWASGMLLITALILISTKWAPSKDGKINLWRTIIIGFSQALAIMPGISRSGSTIACGMFSGLKKSDAAEFSFLLSLPAIAGATLLQIPDFVRSLDNVALVLNYLAGAIVAGIVGYISIAYLLALIKKGRFFYFGIYCAIIGTLGILFL